MHNTLSNKAGGRDRLSWILISVCRSSAVDHPVYVVSLFQIEPLRFVSSLNTLLTTRDLLFGYRHFPMYKLSSLIFIRGW
ncbi:hypothetical protein DBO95_17735, partial [Yersinia pestis]